MVTIWLLRKIFIFATALLVTDASAQPDTGPELARLLANQKTRQSAVSRVSADPGLELPRVLSWMSNPPNGVDRRELLVGMADVFARLRSKDAIPFLIRNIGLGRYGEVDAVGDFWAKRNEVIKDWLPAATALIQIGPPAQSALIRAYWDQPMLALDRPKAIFTISQIGGLYAYEFLSQVMQRASFERQLAQRFQSR